MVRLVVVCLSGIDRWIDDPLELKMEDIALQKGGFHSYSPSHGYETIGPAGGA